MTQIRLADFIRKNIEPILVAWEDFARTIEPPALTMDDRDLRDHAHQMLLVFAADMDAPQSNRQRDAKSMGLAPRQPDDTIPETHAEARLLSGYTVVQLVSEYRALRSSVLTLWGREPTQDHVVKLSDITRFNEAVDQALAESVARYESLLNNSQNMFLAILGHDLRNPLGALVSGTSMLVHATDIPERYVVMAKRMLRSAKRMSHLVRDLIDFTRTHLGAGIPIHTKRSDLLAAVDHIVAEVRGAFPESRIELSVPGHLDAYFDESRVAQMLSNLIGNAVQHGTADAPVRVAVSSAGQQISFTVNNRGSVIPANKLKLIFEPLVRLNDAAEPYTENTSLGIGLFISREIAVAHGGSINVASSPDDGTTFVVTMPQFAGETTAAI